MTYPIPLEALDDRLAWVGMTGAGKTYNAGTAVERLLPRARVVIADPLGVWWGLRLKADGVTPAFPIVVFGGPHGDLPLTERSGAVIGETAAQMAESCIVDLSEIESAAGERRFMLGFLRALYQHATGEPLHLVLDEADMWAPQTIRDKEGDATKLFAITERIVRRGRVEGFIPWLITQRPAEISKSVLSMVDGLIAMRLTSPQDRNALDAWISGQADPGQGAHIKAGMPTLSQGQAVVWIPQRGWLNPQASFPKKTTFDSSAAPKRGENRRDVILRPLDLGALRERLTSVEEEVKLSDPRALKTEIIRLKGELAKAGVAPVMLQEAEAKGYKAGMTRGIEIATGMMRDHAAHLVKAADDLMSARTPEKAQETTLSPALTSPPANPAPAPAAQPARAEAANRETRTPGFNVAGAMGLVTAAASVHPVRLTWGQVAVLADRKPSGGHFNSSRKTALTKDWLREESGLVRVTDEGLAVSGATPLEGDPIDVFAKALPQPAAKMFAVIREQPGISVEGLATTLEMQPRGGHWSTGMAILRRNRLINDDAGKLFVAPLS